MENRSCSSGLLPGPWEGYCLSGLVKLMQSAYGSSSQAKDCVKRMLVRDPTKRATVAEVLSHEWMRENGGAREELIQPEILQRMRQFAGMNRFKKEALKVRGQLTRLQAVR
jgi:serine/threonine protein kinase